MVQLICRRQLAQAADKLNVQFAFCHVKLSYEIFNGKIIYAIFMQINIHNFNLENFSRYLPINFVNISQVKFFCKMAL